MYAVHAVCDRERRVIMDTSPLGGVFASRPRVLPRLYGMHNEPEFRELIG